MIRFGHAPEIYDPTDRDSVDRYLRERLRAGEMPVGLLYAEPESRDMHRTLGPVDRPLTDLSFDVLCPGSDTPDTLQLEFR